MQNKAYSRKGIMKKLAIISLSAGLIMGISGCKADTGGETSQNTEATSSTEEVVTVPAPSDAICKSAQSGSISLEWSKTDTAVSYNVYRSQKPETDKAFRQFTYIGNTADNSFTDTDGAVSANIHWYYKIEAVNGDGIKSAMSETIVTPVTETLVREGTEKLTDRALIAIDLAGDKGAEEYVTATDSEGNEYTKGVYLSWRSFEADPSDVTFTLYRNNTVIAEKLSVTNCIDEGGKYGDVYRVAATSDKELGIQALDTEVWENYYKELTLDLIPEQTLPMKKSTEYTVNDMSVGDLDGDGQYELVVKWYPDESKDNSQTGVTGYTYLDGYDINYATGEASLMWRINLGPNIRSGAHYTQFMVWDMNNDGIAEVACKTADATTTYRMTDEGLVETGYVGACNADAIDATRIGRSEYDFRDSGGNVLKGSEYLTIFRGDTGEILDTTDYIPGRGTINEFGDGGGNRSERYLACVAYCDGIKPCMVFCRGYYAKTCLTAYYLNDNNKLEILWAFDTDVLVPELTAEFAAEYNAETEAEYKALLSTVDFTAMSPEETKEYIIDEYRRRCKALYTGQGNHNLSVADVDNDGKDEIIYGSMTIDNDGSVLYSTGLCHGDAMHVGDFVESNPGLEVFQVHENTGVEYMVELRDAETGTILYGKWVGKDNGRGLAADIDPRYSGAEFWSAADGYIHAAESATDNDIMITENRPSINFDILWDGDLLSEMQDHSFDSKAYAPRGVNITKWDYELGVSKNLLYSSQILTNNGSKGNLCLVADIIGDWREEIIARSQSDRSKVRIYMSTIPTDYVIPCLMEDNNYRLGIAWQNVAYNQPAHLSYNLTEGLRTAVITLETVSDGIIVNFTAASDGIYGHEIEGYEIYRSNGTGYELIGTTDAATLSYKDASATDSSQKYIYKVAAVVDGKTSYFSFKAANK